MTEHVNQIRTIRALCQLMVEQQECILRLISEKLNEFEAAVLEPDDTGRFPTVKKKNEGGL